MHRIDMLNFSTTFGASRLEKRNQMQLTEVGNEMKKMEKENKDENEEEWIEAIVECPDCVNGRVVQWAPRKSDKPPWRYHLPCETCKGAYQSIVWQPKFCQMPSCESTAKHRQ